MRAEMKFKESLFEVYDKRREQMLKEIGEGRCDSYKPYAKVYDYISNAGLLREYCERSIRK